MDETSDEAGGQGDDDRRRHAENRQRRRGQSPSAGNRRLSARHRRPQAQRHRYDLRAARHPDHRPHAQVAGARNARDLLPARAERRLCRVHRRLHDAEAGHLPHGVRPRLSQRIDGARQRHHQLLSDDPHQRLERARDRRPAAGRLRGDGPARHREAARQGGVPGPARRGHWRGRRAGDPRRALRPARRRVSRLAGQAVPADDRRGSREEFADQSRRSGAAPDPGAGRRQARARPAQERQAAADHPRQGRGVRASRCGHSRAGGKDRHPLPAHVDGQGPAARHARAIRLGGALVRAAGSRRRDADRRPLELAAFARQRQDVGRQRRQAMGRPEVHPDRHLAAGGGQQRPHRCAGRRRHRFVRLGHARRDGRHCGIVAASRPPSGSARSRSARRRTSRRWGSRWRRTRRR